MIDAHHHLWDLKAVSYPWLEAQGVERFFGDPTPIQRDYLVDEYREEASREGITASVHIQVGAQDGFEEARWVQSVADENPGWPTAQVVFCDLTSDDLPAQLDAYRTLQTVRGVRQIVGRAPSEDAANGSNTLLDNPRFVDGLHHVASRGLSFDLQLIPELMGRTADILHKVPELKVALCHAGSPHDRSFASLDEWEASLSALSALPNVYCKLSGLGMFEHNWTTESIRSIIETCLHQFGSEKCMFGSNFPVDKLYSDYSALTHAYRTLIPDEMQKDVFSETARRFYGLA